jgi:signal transduction histidine kinase
MARTPGTRSDVGKVVNAIVVALTRLHAGSGVKISHSVEPGLLVALDEQDLNELLANLVDNAFKFAASSIAIRAFVAGDMIQIVVEDDGPGLPAEARELVFAPGKRLDESKPGTGLGLAIVRDIVELYRGGIQLKTTSMGGLAAELRLPKVGS